ncbi:zinc finger protein 879-like isoform X2 [Alosa alosa]|uniref:zinc finger protein 879-like isoform X2 n=1 Tax=Alosa alosa TaxID=278164 RepID=UPI0020150A5D|nr:zinc finger protein 879-like isoform X2 [Alosa alosa]
MADKPPPRKQPKRIRSEEQKLKKKGYDLARAKSRVNIGVGFQRWRNLRELKCMKTDEDLALFLLDCFDQNSLSPGIALRVQSIVAAVPGPTPVKSEELNHSSADEVVVKLECLLQLFKECLACCSECSISTERDGWFFYVTQKCQQCHYSRNWASHPTDQIISDPAENHEGDDVVTVIYDGSDDSMDGQRETNTEDKDDPALSGVATTVKDSDEEEEEDEEDEEDEDDDSDEEWVMKSKKFWSPLGAAEGPAAASSERSEASREAEHEPPMVWCNNCNTEFTRSCYRLRHKRIYGCIQCGTKDVANTTTTSTAGNSDANTPNSNQDVANTTTTTSTAGNPDANTPNSNQDVANTTTTTSAGNPESNNQEITTNTTTRNAEHGALNFQDLAVCFGDLHSFQKHARHCHGIKEFRDPCPDCGKFITLRNKVSGGPPHICEHKARPNSCLVCGKGFASQKGLLSHMTWVHLKGKPNIVRCNYCLKRFTFRKQKIEHEKVHQNEELKFSCPHCPLRFPDCYARSAHRKTHRVFNTFTCKVCNRTFKQACKLERHMAVHTGLKPYTCKLCDRSFNQSGHLKSHMRVHTGERPFKCQDCGQCFNHNVSLKNHIQRKHKPRAGEWTSGEEEDRGDLGSGLN